jgi:HEAT repeat protein
MNWCGTILLTVLVGGPAGAPPADPLDAAVPVLVKALKDPDEQVRTLAVNALSMLDERAVPALIGLLEGKDRALKVQAAGVLSNMAQTGRRHPAALPALLKCLEDEDTLVRRAAISAVAGIAVKALEKAPDPGRP